MPDRRPPGNRPDADHASQVDVEREIVRLIGEQADALAQYEVLVVDAADAKVLYEVEHAKAYLRSRGTIPERESWATYRCESYLTNKEATAALLRACAKTLDVIGKDIDALRTLSANIRSAGG